MALPQITKNGHKTYEVMSAIQKEIRRGNEKEALYWVYELCESNLLSLAAGRLRVIALEDVGNADMMAIVYAFLCIDQAQAWYKGKNDAWQLAFGNAVMALSRAKKTRIGDSFHAVAWDEHQRIRKAIPDYALDKHTARGRAMGRGLDHFMTEGAKLSNEDAENYPDIYLEAALDFWTRRNAEKDARRKPKTKADDLQQTLC